MLTLNRVPLAAALRALAPIVKGGAGDPRFACVLLDATDGVHVTAVSPDYALVGQRWVAYDGEYGDGSAALIPHRWLLDAVESMPGATVRLDLNGSRATLSAGRSRMGKPTLPADELVLPAPLANLAERCALTGGEMAHGFAQVAYAASTDDTRPALKTVLLENTGGSLRFVAINGPQVAVHVVDDGEGHGKAPFRLSIPREAVPTLSRFFAADERVRVLHGTRGEVNDDATAVSGVAYAAFSGESGSLRVRLPEADYPQFAGLLEVEPWAVVTLDRVAFAGAVARAVIQQEQARTTLRVTDETLHILADDLSEAVPADVIKGEMVFSFNPMKMEAALAKVTDETVTMERRGGSMIYLHGAGLDLHGFGRLHDERGAK